MSFEARIRNIGGREELFCPWRKKYVRLTPEEWVRQNVLELIVEQIACPRSRVGVEYQIEVGQTIKRCDAVIFDEQLQPICVVEFKAENVSLTQKVFDQVAVYNRQLKVKYFIISNGKTTYSCKLGETGYEFLPNLLSYKDMCE